MDPQTFCKWLAFQVVFGLYHWIVLACIVPLSDRVLLFFCGEALAAMVRSTASQVSAPVAHELPYIRWCSILSRFHIWETQKLTLTPNGAQMREQMGQVRSRQALLYGLLQQTEDFHSNFQVRYHCMNVFRQKDTKGLISSWCLICLFQHFFR